ncbi:MAG: hypothetical protein AAB439_00535 [Patescibacteria group bacterium]
MKKNVKNVWASSFDCVVGACAEVKMGEQKVLMRMTGKPDIQIAATKEEWVEFIKAAKKGQFDY